MDIHKPKPVHGWRELLSEIGIIVLGVLIALGAEQAVETLHWRHQVTETQAALKTEIGLNLTDAAERLMVNSCLRDRIAELRVRLAAPGDVWKADPARFPVPPDAGDLPVMLPVYWAPRRLWRRGAWDAAVSSGVLSHFPREETATYSLIYRYFDLTAQTQQAELAIGPELAPLAHDERLTADQKAAAMKAVAQLDAMNYGLVLLATQVIELAQQHGVAVDPEAKNRRFAGMRTIAGPCVQDVKLPLR